MEITKKKIVLGVAGLLIVGAVVTVAMYLRSGSSLKGDLANPPVASISADQASYDLATNPTMKITFSVPDSAQNGTISFYLESDPSQVVRVFDFTVKPDKTVSFSDPQVINLNTTPSGPHSFGYVLPETYENSAPLVAGTPADFMLALNYSTGIQALIPPTNSTPFQISNSAIFPKVTADPTSVTLDQNETPLTITFNLPKVAVEGSIDIASAADPLKKVKSFTLKQVNGVPEFSADADANIKLIANKDSSYSFSYTFPKAYADGSAITSGDYTLAMTYQTNVPALIPPVTGPNIKVTVPAVNQNQSPDLPASILATPYTVDLASNPQVKVTFGLPAAATNATINFNEVPDNAAEKPLHTFNVSVNQGNLVFDGGDSNIQISTNNDGTHSFTYNIPATFPDNTAVIPDKYMMSMTNQVNGVQSSPVYLYKGLTLIKTDPNQTAANLPMIAVSPYTVDLSAAKPKVHITFGLPAGASGQSIDFYQVPDNDALKELEKLYINNDNNQLSVTINNGNTSLPLTKNNDGTYSFDYTIAKTMKDGSAVTAGKYVLSLSSYSNSGTLPPVYTGFITFTVPVTPPPSPQTPPPSPQTPPPSPQTPSPSPQSPSPSPSPVVYNYSPQPPVTPPPAIHGAADEKVCGGFSDASIFSAKVCALAQLMKDNGIFTGSAFRQTQLVKRYEAALAVVRAFKLSAQCVPSVLNTYHDIDEKASYFDELCTANNVGVIKGYQNDPQYPVLLPTRNVSYREFARMITNAYIIAHIGKAPRSYGQISQALGFDINPYNGWFGYAFQFLVNEKVLTVDDFKLMDLDRGMTRLEVAQTLEKVLNDLKVK